MDNTSSFSEPTLGTLSRLPPELRLHIYSYVLPQHFSQQLIVDEETDIISRPLCAKKVIKAKAIDSIPVAEPVEVVILDGLGEADAIMIDQAKKVNHPTDQKRDSQEPLIGLLYVSKWVREESLPALAAARTCKITVAASTITSNALIYDRVFSDERTLLTIPPCKTLELVMDVPHPRCAQGLTAVRRTAEVLATQLKKQNKPLPPTVAILDPQSQGGVQYTYNDYAMMLGPLGCLRGVASIVVVCSSALMPGFVDPACLNQCQLIEAAMRESGNGGLGTVQLLQQQLLITLKLELMFYADEQAIASTRARFYNTASPKPIQLGIARFARVGKALFNLRMLLTDGPKWRIAALRTVKGTNGGSGSQADGVMVFEGGRAEAPVPAAALDELFQLFDRDGAKAMIPKNLTDAVLGFPTFNTSDYFCWASGFLTVRNPFY